MVQFHMRMSDHADIQNLGSPSQELSEYYNENYICLETDNDTRVYTTV